MEPLLGETIFDWFDRKLNRFMLFVAMIVIVLLVIDCGFTASLSRRIDELAGKVE